MKSYQLDLEHKLRNKGASIVGFADLSELPEQIRDNYKYGIIIAVALNPIIVSKIYPGPSIEYYNEYRRINNLLHELDDYTVEILNEYEFTGLSKKGSVVVVDQSNKRSKLPHKTVATRAGIGWIGKCALLITKEFGAAIRISSVLTNAEFEVGTPINEAKCGDCTVCKEICPAKSVTGLNWDVSRDRDELFIAMDCRDKITERGLKLNLSEGMCGLCIWACPWTKRYLKNS